MTHSQDHFSARRRRFLCTAGVATIAMSPVARAALAGSVSGSLRLGIVLPPSARYPELANELLAGFEAYVASSGGHSMKLLPLACGRGARAPLLAAEEAVKSGRVDMLAGLISRNLASQMSPLLEASGTPFVVCDIGADIVRQRDEGAHLIRNCLGYWQTNYAMGGWSAANLGARALIAADFLESGYDMVYAFRRAFEAQGGKIVGVEVTGLPDGSGRFSDVADAIRSLRPDFVYAFYSGKRAESFLGFYESSRLSRIAPLAGAGLLTESASSSTLPAGLAGVTTASPWAADIETAENRVLRSAYKKAHGGEVGLFAMLGYETAQRIAAGIAAVEGNTRDRARFAGALAGATFAGPRGAVIPLAGMSDAATPVYVRRLSQSGDRLVNVTTARIPAVNLPPAAAHELRAMIKSGWAQAYLAA